MSRTYFGTDGIRGTVGQAPITPDFMLRLGHAVGRVLKAHTPRATVLIGKDTRISGYMIESALCSRTAFTSAAGDVAPKPALMLTPSGLQPMRTTSAPNSWKTSGAV